MGAYNLVVARGWESKSVEQQQEEATTSAEQRHTQLTPEQIADQKRRQGLELSRQHILQQLKVASNPQHRNMLEAALADLEAQLTADKTTPSR
jgi:signal recognition particle GTPase